MVLSERSGRGAGEVAGRGGAAEEQHKWGGRGAEEQHKWGGRGAEEQHKWGGRGAEEQISSSQGPEPAELARLQAQLRQREDELYSQVKENIVSPHTLELNAL